MKFLIAITILLLGTSVAYGEIIQSTVAADSFAKAPVAVLDPAQDTLFSSALAPSIFFSAGKSKDTLYVWSITFDNSSNTTTSIIRKSIDASSLEEKDTPVSINAAIESKFPVAGLAGLGFIGMVAIRDSGEGTADNLFFNVLAADADNTTLPTEVQLTDNSDTAAAYYVAQVFFLKDYFYVLYIQFETAEGNEKALYLQAVKGSDASLLWKDAVKIADLNNPPASTMAQAGGDDDDDADKILVVYKDMSTKALMQTTVEVSNGKVDEATSLVTDSDDIMHVPNGIISADDVYGLIVNKQTMQQESVVDDLKLYLDGSTSKPLELDLTGPTNYNTPVIKAFDHDDGFALIAQYAGENDFQYLLKIFNEDGTAEGEEKTLLTTRASMNFFADADGNIWLGYVDFNSEDGALSTGYLGMVLAKD